MLLAVAVATYAPYIVLHVESRYLLPAAFAYLLLVALGLDLLAERAAVKRRGSFCGSAPGTRAAVTRPLLLMTLFDEYETTYHAAVEEALAFSGRGHAFFTAVKVRELVRELHRIGDPAALRVLDVGCGVGETDTNLAPQLGSLEGTDVSEALLRRARDANPRVPYSRCTDEELPYGDAAFDAAFAICVLHHVEPMRWTAFLTEIARVVRPGGLLCVFEHNPLNPLTRRVVSNCVFDEDATLLSRRRLIGLQRDAGLRDVRGRDILFVPFDGPGVARVEHALGRLPLGAQYCVAGRVAGA